MLAFADAGEAAAFTGVATIAATSITAYAAVHSRSRTIEAVNERLHSMEDDVARLRRTTELMTESFARWRNESDRTLISELAQVRADMQRVVTAVERRDS
jgi:biopolymer transport protein ExbB/TolQ